MTYSDPLKTSSPSSTEGPANSSKVPDPGEVAWTENWLAGLRQTAAQKGDLLGKLLVQAGEDYLAKLKTGELED